MKKRFIVGLNLDESFEDYDKFIQKYKEYIYAIYFSLPLGKRFHSRSVIHEQYSNEYNLKLFKYVTNLLERYKIKREVVINTNLLYKEDLRIATDYIQNNRNVDEIVCMDKYLEYLYGILPEFRYIRSYNNVNTKKINNIYSEIVVGKDYLRSKRKRHELLQKGYKVQLLLNSGCSFNCPGCFYNSGKCMQYYLDNIKKFGINYIYAMQSFFPNELKKLIEKDKLEENYKFKISNRPGSLEYTSKVLDSYINNIPVEYYIDNNKKNYYMWGILKNYELNFNEFNLDKIKRYKNKLFDVC